MIYGGIKCWCFGIVIWGIFIISEAPDVLFSLSSPAQQNLPRHLGYLIHYILTFQYFGMGFIVCIDLRHFDSPLFQIR